MKKFLMAFLLTALFTAPLWADGNEWQNLENALKGDGIIKEGEGTKTTENLPGGGTRTVVTNTDGSRSVTIEGRTSVEPKNHTMNFDKDGHVTSETKGYSDGSTSSTTTNADGTTVSHTTTAEGMQVGTIFNQDGSSITTSSGGGSEPTETRKSADGTLTTTVNHADGTKTQTSNPPNGEVTTTQIGADGKTTSERVNHADGTHTNTEFKDGKPVKGTLFSAGGYPRPVGETVYDKNGVKLRDVIRDRWGDKIVEVIYYNPDGTVNRRAKDPNAVADPFADQIGMKSGGVDARDSQHDSGFGEDQFAKADHGHDHHDG